MNEGMNGSDTEGIRMGGSVGGWGEGGQEMEWG